MKILKKISILVVVLILLVILSISSIIYFDLLNTKFAKTEDAIYYNAKTINKFEKTKKLKIMTWNIKFGAARIDMFFDCHGNTEIFSKKEAMKNLDNLAKKINEINPDIIFLQEIDIDSNRSGNINQLQYLLDKTELNYGVYASQWRVDYLPKHNIKNINSGNAILSKFKIRNAKRFSLPLIDSQDFITKYLYLKKNILKAEIFNLTLLNTHLSAYADSSTVTKQVKELQKRVQFYTQKDQIVIFGGDFNLIPPTSKKIDDFPDNACIGSFEADSFKDELNLLNPIYKNYKSAIKLDDFNLDNSKYFTHTTDKSGFWNRKLDYLFTNGDFIDGKVLQDTISLSDHAPIVVTTKIYNDIINK